MKLFLHFLRSQWRSLTLFGLCACIFLLSFWLYGLPAGAVLYPLCLCVFLGLWRLLAEYVRTLRRHREMEQLQQLSYELLKRLPEPRTIAEEDDSALILRLRQELQELGQADNQRFLEALDYYTVWAHQIKTPLAAMKLRLQREDSALSRELSTEVFRVEQYADMVMAYLRLEEGEGDYVFRQVELDELLRGSIRRFSSEFIAKRLSLQYEGCEKTLVTDEKWLSFVVEQLLSNAIKYTAFGGITVALRDNELWIEDTGMGIAPEDLPRIFEKGYTGYNGRRDKRASGIGLFLCKKVCAKLGMGLRAESTLGKGTKMILTLEQRHL